MSARSEAEREAARREREIRRLERAGEPVPPELREPVTPAPEPVDAAPEPTHAPVPTPAPAPPPPPPPPPDDPWHDPDDPWHDAPPPGALPPPAIGVAGSAPAGAPARPRRRRWGLIVLGVLGVLAVAAAWFLVSLFQPGAGDGTGRVVVTVPAGASTSQIADQLAAAGVVDSSFLFGLRARLAGDELRSGRHVLARDMSYGAAITALSTPPKAAPVTTLTLPEGLSRREVAPRARAAGLSGSYLAATVRSPVLNPRRYGAPAGTPSLEGFLFPATYQVRDGAPVRRLVDQQLRTFRQRFATVPMRRARRKNLTGYDVVTIASMIEREAAVSRDRRLIAAVIYNRLKAGIPLGIDATTRFEYGEWTAPLKQSQLTTDSPYNTRTRKGLPPTPIGNPGLAALRAAANPAPVSYLFYVVKPCGNGAHAFSSTDAQFQKDVAAYNAARAKNGGNDPSRCK